MSFNPPFRVLNNSFVRELRMSVFPFFLSLPSNRCTVCAWKSVIEFYKKHICYCLSRTREQHLILVFGGTSSHLREPYFSGWLLGRQKPNSTSCPIHKITLVVLEYYQEWNEGAKPLLVELLLERSQTQATQTHNSISKSGKIHFR